MSVEDRLYINAREKKTVSRMIRIYCRSMHGYKHGLCYDCRQLQNYVHKRLKYCTFGENKPACKDCTVHCYNAEYQKKIQEVMRFSGPRMFLYYPLDAIRHLWKSFGFYQTK